MVKGELKASGVSAGGWREFKTGRTARRGHERNKDKWNGTGKSGPLARE